MAFLKFILVPGAQAGGCEVEGIASILFAVSPSSPFHPFLHSQPQRSTRVSLESHIVSLVHGVSQGVGFHQRCFNRCTRFSATSSSAWVSHPTGLDGAVDPRNISGAAILFRPSLPHRWAHDVDSFETQHHWYHWYHCAACVSWSSQIKPQRSPCSYELAAGNAWLCDETVPYTKEGWISGLYLIHTTYYTIIPVYIHFILENAKKHIYKRTEERWRIPRAATNSLGTKQSSLEWANFTWKSTANEWGVSLRQGTHVEWVL